MRNRIIDIARGLCIIFVCVFHIVYTPENSLPYNFINSGVWLSIPFFFVLSGYLYKPSRHNIIYRIKSILIPSVKYSFILLVVGGIYCAVFHSYTFRGWLVDVLLTYLRPEFSLDLITLDVPHWNLLLYDIISPIWFIWTMVWTLPVFYALVGYTSKSIRNLVLCCVLLLITSILLYDYSSYFSWSLTLVPVYAAVMFCGSYCANAGVFERIVASRNYMLALIAAAVHFMMFLLCGSPRAFMNELGTIGKWSVIAFFVQTFIGSYALILFCVFLADYKYISDFVEFVGINSLLFMLAHRSFGVVFSDIMGTYIKSGDYWTLDNVTVEIFVKSLTVLVLSLISCSIFIMIKDKR
ncbi:MAG: acyltransferase family protein [Synergistaceae bacterium]|nr:acyltransferase family protein [Synergistaceae bacterium]